MPVYLDNAIDKSCCTQDEAAKEQKSKKFDFILKLKYTNVATAIN
jgi:hypothetical protein